MNFEQYAAQQAQGTQRPQNTPQTQEALPVDLVAAKLDADKLYSLMAEAQEAIEEKASPAEIAARMTGALWGTSSPQAAAVDAIIEAEAHPGGHEMALASIRAQRKLLRAQLKQLEAQAKTLTGELEKLDKAEWDLTRDQSKAAALDRALLDVLTFSKQLDADNPQADLLQELTAIYDRHHGNPAAMGLLYGCIADLNRRQYSAKVFDLVRQQEYKDLTDRIAAAIGIQAP